MNLDKAIYNGYNSSAQKLDELLAVRGGKTDFRFAHNYILPQKMPPEQYEEIISAYGFYMDADWGKTFKLPSNSKLQQSLKKKQNKKGFQNNESLLVSLVAGARFELTAFRL